MIMNLHEPAATALAGVDLARNDRMRTTSRPRMLKGIGLVGSTVVDDFWADIFVGSQFIGRFYNTHAGVLQVDQLVDVKPVGPWLVAGGDQISVICGINATTNPVNVVLQ